MNSAYKHRDVVFGIMILSAMTAMGAETAEAAKALPSPEPVIVSMIRLLGALVFVFALFFCGIWVFKNWQRLLIKRGAASKLHVLEVKSLGQRQALYVVGYERQRMLLSSSPAGITLLTHLPESENEAAPAPTPAPAFSEVLLKVLNKK